MKDQIPVQLVRKPDTDNHQTQSSSDDLSLQQKIVDALKTIYDPEIPVNIYDLGLIYKIDIDDKNNVKIKMTLTAPNCPVAGSLPSQVECMAKSVVGVNDAIVDLVWDPPWDQSRMSDEAKLALNMW